jgi:hypothetical protein
MHALSAVGEINKRDVNTAKLFISMLKKEKDEKKRQRIVLAMGTHCGMPGVKMLLPILTALRNNLRETEQIRNCAEVSLVDFVPVLEQEMLAGMQWKGAVKEAYMMLWEIRPLIAELAFQKWIKQVGIRGSDIQDRPSLPGRHATDRRGA